jgi:hypothetical protein
MTQLADLVESPPDIESVSHKLVENLATGLGYNEYQSDNSDAVLN